MPAMTRPKNKKTAKTSKPKKTEERIIPVFERLTFFSLPKRFASLFAIILKISPTSGATKANTNPKIVSGEYLSI